MKVTEIKPNPDNPRVIKDAQYKKLVQSLKDLPKMAQIRPIAIDENNIIQGGNQRFRAMQELGWTEIPVVVMDDTWTEEEKREFIIKDNRDFGEDDWVKLESWDKNLLEQWGMELPNGFNELEVKEDEAPEVSTEPPVSKLGEVYQLGRHRVMCGDSTDKPSVELLMNGAKADMVFTDPPYGMGKEKDGVLNDNFYGDKLLIFNRKWIPISFGFIKDNGSWYCWGIDEPLMDIYSDILKPMIKKQLATFRNVITWDKGNGQGQLAEDFRSYATADEKCLFVMCGVQGFNTNQDNYYEGWEPIRLYLQSEKKKVGWTDKWIAEQLHVDPRLHWFGRSQWDLPTREKYQALQSLAHGKAFNKKYDVLKSEYDVLKSEYDVLKSQWYETRAYFDNLHDNMNNVWHFKRHQDTGDEGNHATPKPIELCIRGIKSSSREGEVVLDLFLGSGSTLIACEQTDRTCYGMELDPNYVDVIRKRYAKFIGEEDWQAVTPVVE